MTTFFHVAPNLLGVGSTILPGNWGRILKLYTTNQANEPLYRETIVEQIRQSEFPHKPSRLDAIFALETLEEAKLYRDLNCKWNIIYEISIETTDQAIHKGSYTFNIDTFATPNGVICGPNVLNTDGLYNGYPMLARQYWSTCPTKNIEVVINAPATIVRRIP